MQSEELRHPAGIGLQQGGDFFQLAAAVSAGGYRNHLALSFPQGEVASHGRGTLTPAFLGLLGVSGTLPYRYTELLAGPDGAPARALFDVLSSQAVAVLVDAWRAGRPGSTPDSGPGGQGVASRAVMGARAIGERLAVKLGVPVRVEQFCGAWDALPAQHCCTLGGGNNSLGRSAMLGARMWRLDLQVRVHVGPLPLALAPSFVPGGQGALALAAAWCSASGGALAQAHIVPAAGVAPGAVLGVSVRLGHSSHLHDRRFRLSASMDGPNPVEKSP